MSNAEIPDHPDLADFANSDGGTPVANAAEIREWIRAKVAEALGVPVGQVDARASFIELGVDSVTLFSMTGQLAEWFNRDLPATMLFEISSINDLVAALTPSESR
jgi:acyl carrier protein